jgi:hypothetical protein
MQEALIHNAQIYASRHNLQLVERLGYGVHGIVIVAEDKGKPGKTAVKAHEHFEPYVQERQVYQRLQEAGITQVIGFNVPELIRCDDELQIIEMTIVTPPFVLDFAGARLDFPPEFSDEVWAEWEAEKQEQFGSRWPEARAVLGALEEFDIYVLDVSPRNISFA